MEMKKILSVQKSSLLLIELISNDQIGDISFAVAVVFA